MKEIRTAADSTDASRKRILIVDDDAEVREVIVEFLGGHGFEPLQAGDGLEALLQIKRVRPDGVILDLQMPRLGGLEALKRIHAFDAAITVVVVTAETDPHVREQALALGATAVLDKPVDFAALLAAIWLESPASPASAAATPKAAGTSEMSRPEPSRAPRVLVVDDEPDISGMLAEFLRSRRYEVRVAADGAAAIREIVHAPPDVVLLDVVLPGLSGAEALPTIRALAPRAAVIMVSGSTNAEISKRTLAHGAFDYVTKPIDLDYLARSIETAVAMSALEEPPP